jgi:hypothetical protein
MNAPALTHADAVPVRLAAERLHRLDIQGAWGRLPFSQASDRRLYHDLRHAATRRQLVLNLDAACHAAPARERA